MNTETQIVPAKWDAEAPAANYRMAQNAAAACKEIALRTAVAINGRRYVIVEAWQAIALAHGCIASACDVAEVRRDGAIVGFRATGQVRLMASGQVIAEAEGFVGNDEARWKKRDEYAKRAMAQTRGISRACRSAFAHVVVLMDAGLSTTPAEEVPDEGFVEPNETDSYTAARDSDYASARREQPAHEASSNEEPRDWHEAQIHFGKNKGVRIGDLEPQQLSWYQKEWQPRPFRGRISDQDLVLRAALDASMGKSTAPQTDPMPAQAEELDEVPF